MRSKADILAELAQAHVVEYYVNAYARPTDRANTEDLSQDVWLYLLSLPARKVTRIYYGGNIRGYISTLVWRQLHRRKSEYHRRYLRPTYVEIVTAIEAMPDKDATANS